MIEVTAAVKSAEELDKAVGLIAKLVGKLRAKPDLAAQKLGQALSEIAKTLQAVDNATWEFLSVGIDADAMKKGSQLMLKIEGGGLSLEVERGRGHCHVISHIYWHYLDKWFNRALEKREYPWVKSVFERLGNADSDLFGDLVKVANVLEAEASAVFDMAMKGDEAGARARVLASLPTLRPLRKTISKTMHTLYTLQSVFIDITGAV